MRCVRKGLQRAFLSTATATATATLLLMAIGPTRAAAAPQTFNTALPVAKGDFLLREQILAFEASDDPSPADRELEIFGLISVLGYGITSDLAVFGVLPVLDKKLDLRLPDGQRLTRSTTGLGDARLFARYTALQRDARGRSFRLAPFIGIELPTGDDGADDRLGRLPRPLQLGSGSWDPFGGLIATYQTLAYQIDAELSYQINTRADDFESGDELRLDASWQYRLWPRQLGGGVPGFFYGVIEGNLLYQAKDEMDGARDPDSGGTRLSLSPGLQYVTRRWILEAIVQLPVLQELNGAALEEDYAVRAGFRVNF